MRGIALVAAVAAVATTAGLAAAEPSPPAPWDGRNPFECVLQQAGFGAEVPDPGADPLCIEYDKRRQNVTELGLIEFLSREPARVALASDKCFYFQSDHWRGSVVQEDGSTKTYEWDGHYFFDKATGDGGVWVTNFNVNGRTGDPTSLPGFPADWAQYFGSGTGGLESNNQVPVDPRCVAMASERPPYAKPPPAERPVECRAPSGDVAARRLGGVEIGTPESGVWERLGRPARIHRGFLRYCQPDGGKLMFGFPGDRSGESGPPGSAPVRFMLTTHPALDIAGVGAGDPARAVRRAFPRARRWFVMGTTRILRLRPTVLAGMKDGRVRLLAVRDARRVRGAAAVRDWLRRSR